MIIKSAVDIISKLIIAKIFQDLDPYCQDQTWFVFCYLLGTPTSKTIKTPSHTPSILFLSEESYDMVQSTLKWLHLKQAI